MTNSEKFINPNHPLVQQHAAILNVIKQRMVTIRMTNISRKLQNHEEVTKEYEECFKPRIWSAQELEAFEEASDLRLPGEYKVYLMEIGSAGDIYFMNEGVPGIDDPSAAAIESMKKAFTITSDNIHDVNNRFGVKAWTYSFGLPEGSKITDGCLFLGSSWGQNELYLVANGEFENEVWSNTLQYGAEAGGCFGAASTQRLTFLQFIAESLQATLDDVMNASEEGDWL